MNCSRCAEHPKRPGQRWCKACHAKYMRATRPKHSELPEAARKKANARSYANTYQSRGHLQPRPCEVCGAAKAEKHHTDYTKPLLVCWLCRSCHLADHRHVEHMELPLTYEDLPRGRKINYLQEVTPWTR